MLASARVRAYYVRYEFHPVRGEEGEQEEEGGKPGTPEMEKGKRENRGGTGSPGQISSGPK